jgi:hypothetical protein
MDTIRLLHIAPDPGGGWLVEADDHQIVASSYDELDEAVRDAHAYVAAHRGWRVVVHDHGNPAAGRDGYEEARPAAV